MLLPVTTEDIDLAPPDGRFWQALRNLAVGMIVACALALIAGFLVGTSAHAQEHSTAVDHSDGPGPRSDAIARGGS